MTSEVIGLLTIGVLVVINLAVTFYRFGMLTERVNTLQRDVDWIKNTQTSNRSDAAKNNKESGQIASDARKDLESRLRKIEQLLASKL